MGQLLRAQQSVLPNTISFSEQWNRSASNLTVPALQYGRQSTDVATKRSVIPRRTLQRYIYEKGTIFMSDVIKYY